MRKLVAAFAVLIMMAVFIPVSSAETALEAWNYSDNFEDRDLGAWASYPHWQDIAYDPNFRVNEIVPGDPNISIVQIVTPYTNVDNYAGAQKLLDMYLVPGAKVSFRYYLKSHLPSDYFKVRFAAGKLGKLDVTISNPVRNKWEWVTVDFNDFVRENPSIAGKELVKIYALAFLTKIPDADPAMPFYLGLDDISFSGARLAAFKFAEPLMHKLPEFKPYIPRKHYYKGDSFKLSGQWSKSVNKVSVEIAPLTDPAKKVYTGRLTKKGEDWSLKSLKLNFPEGVYLGKLLAFNGSSEISETEFTIHIAPKGIGGKHPRLLFDDEKVAWMKERFKEERFAKVYEEISTNAKSQREDSPVSELIYDLDQFPDEKWLATWANWGDHIYHTDASLLWNSLAYTFHGDTEAGEYAKDVLVTLAAWPDWTHPWQTKRGRFSEHRTGSWSHRVAYAYDQVYELMTEAERTKVRKAIMKNIVGGAFRTYVYNDNITGKTSNWLAMITGGSLINMASMFEDGPETENVEPYFTGTLLKYWAFINAVTDSPDGAWGEGLGYNNYSFHNMSYSVPSLNNVFNVDVSAPLAGSYNEMIWSGFVKDRQNFYFGDSGGNINPLDNWAYLLDIRKSPRLGWFYNYMKYGKVVSNTRDSNGSVRVRDKEIMKEQATFVDVLYDTDELKQDPVWDENPVKFFREVGSAVLKSGWESDDFSFTMRSGAFVNHQHLDQGTFWLADRGVLFIEERHNSTYYDDPIYQPWYTQPVGHSTILIDGNYQSQRVGDHLNFAPGFDDHASLTHALDGEKASFFTGDIGKLYWGKVESLRRNVLYLKPRTLLMLDTAVPGEKDADVTLLYQTQHLEDITAADDISTITKDGVTLNIMHLSPAHVASETVETPHYLYTLRNERPLKKEGMLTVTARTAGNPLVMANLITTTTGGAPDVSYEAGDGFVQGTASGQNFAYSTTPGDIYEVENMKTDALAITWDGASMLAAQCKTLLKNDRIVVESDSPMTFELSSAGIKYAKCAGGSVAIGIDTKPAAISIDGESVKFSYDSEKKAVLLAVPKGEGMITVK